MNRYLLAREGEGRGKDPFPGPKTKLRPVFLTMRATFALRAVRKLRRTLSASAEPVARMARDAGTMQTASGKRLRIIPRIGDAVVPPEAHPTWPVFRLIDEEGELVPGAAEPEINVAECRRLYEVMVRIEELDKIFFMAQRQGRISFYLSSSGEEGIAVGAASALDADDIILAQARRKPIPSRARDARMLRCLVSCVGATVP